jgi:hypothetical protein
MRVTKALVFTTWLYSLLLWLYLVARIILNKVNVFANVIYFVPYLSFWILGAISFTLSFTCLFVYLAVWGMPWEAQSDEYK